MIIKTRLSLHVMTVDIRYSSCKMSYMIQGNFFLKYSNSHLLTEGGFYGNGSKIANAYVICKKINFGILLLTLTSLTNQF